MILLSEHLEEMLSNASDISSDLNDGVVSCEEAIEGGDKTRATREKYALAISLAHTFSQIEEATRDFYGQIDFLEGE